MAINDFFGELTGQRQKGRLPHWEHWSDPDAETYLTGIDHYTHPKRCRERMEQLYPELNLSVPDTDEPLPHPRLTERSPSADGTGSTVRWGDGETATWEHGEKFFRTEEDVFAFDPLSHADMRDWPHVVENHDFRDEETVYREMLANLPTENEGRLSKTGRSDWFYNTTFMWPLLTFGWELFLSCSQDERFEPVMEGFAEINRRVFRAMSRLPIQYVVCHDDIFISNGPVCSPQWMRKYVFPRYEEYWSMLRNTGKTVIFMADGCSDSYAADVFVCGARGLITEPYTDFKRIARQNKDVFLAGEGDNRILMRNDPTEIAAMVDGMVETSRLAGGYMMCIGNHIPWNVPGEAVKRYLDLCGERAFRT